MDPIDLKYFLKSLWHLKIGTGHIRTAKLYLASVGEVDREVVDKLKSIVNELEEIIKELRKHDC